GVAPGRDGHHVARPGATDRASAHATVLAVVVAGIPAARRADAGRHPPAGATPAAHTRPGCAGPPADAPGLDSVARGDTRAGGGVVRGGRHPALAARRRAGGARSARPRRGPD